VRRAGIAAIVALLVCTGGGVRAIADEATLSEMVDSLQRLQVKMAAGDKAAYAAEAVQLRVIANAVLASKPERWKDKNESIAAIVYLLSGGQPRDIAKVLQGGFVPKPEETLMRGALAYTLGRERDAAALIGAIDPRKLDLRIAGQFAYVLGTIEIQRNPKRALDLLDLARLLAPGGLVEEASLRREILLAGEQKDTDRVAMLARQYLIRFGSSIYASNFMQSFAFTVVRLNLIDSLASFEKFQRSGRSMNSENRRAFMLAVARGELESGKFDIAGEAAFDALRETASESTDEARGQL
jgi:chemotaxis protein MotC